MTKDDFFAKLRAAIPGIWNKSGTIKEGDDLWAAYQASLKPDPPREAEQPGNPAQISQRGMDLIKQFEGCAQRLSDGRIRAYPDPGSGGDPWTIGWGATGPDIRKGTIWTQQQADDWFDHHIRRYAGDVARAIGSAPTSQAQFDALVSFHYNTGAIGTATLTRKHKAGDYAGATAEFARWNKAAGRVMAGLTRRRLAEAALYKEGSR